mgnify:FL=1
MNLKIFLLALITFSGFNLFGQGIEFFHGSWDEAKAMAKESDKLVFVDAYTSWCGPCKRMAADIFPQPEVGSYFNKNFINFKLDMEKGEGPAFAKKYGIRAYPTFVFIDGEGNLVFNKVGGSDAAGFIQMATAAVNKFDRSPVYAKKYEEGDKSPQLILDYIKALNAANKSSLKVANDYLNENKTGSSDIHYKIIYEAATSSDSKPFDQLIANEKKIVKIYSQQDFNKRKYAALIASVRKSIEYESPDLLASAQETAKKVLDKDNNKIFQLESTLIQADAAKDGPKYVSIASEIGKALNEKSFIDIDPIIKSLTTLYVGEKDMKSAAALLYSKQADLSDDPSKRLEYAIFLDWSKDKDNALKEALKAKSEAEKKNQDTTKYDNTILRINSK